MKNTKLYKLSVLLPFLIAPLADAKPVYDLMESVGQGITSYYTRSKASAIDSAETKAINHLHDVCEAKGGDDVKLDRYVLKGCNMKKNKYKCTVLARGFCFKYVNN